MAIKTKLDTLDGVGPIDPKTAFKQSADGKWELDIESVDGRLLENVDGLKATISSANTLAKTLQGQLKAYTDAGITNPQSAAEAIAKAKTMETWTPEQKVQEQLKSQAQQLDEKRVTEVAAAKAESEKLRGNLHNVLCKSAAISAIAKHKPKGDPAVILPLVLGSMRIENDAKGEPVARITGPDGNVLLTRKSDSTDEMEVDEYVGILKTRPGIAEYFMGADINGGGPQTPQGGGGSGGGGGGANAPVKISKNDKAAISRNIEGIAKGSVIVVDN